MQLTGEIEQVLPRSGDHLAAANPPWPKATVTENQQVFTRHLGQTLRALARHMATRTALDPLTEERLLTTLDLVLHETSHSLWPAAWHLLAQLQEQIEQRGYYEQWLGPLHRAVDTATAAQAWVELAGLALQRGDLLRLQGKWDEAEQAYDQAQQALAAVTHEWAEETQQHPAHGAQTQQLVIQINNRLAYLARLRGRLDEAEHLACAALTAAGVAPDDTGEPTNVLPTGTAAAQPSAAIEYSYFVLGTVAHDRQDFATAQRYLQRALDHCLRAGDPRKIAQRQRDVALVLANQGQLTAAKALLTAAVEALGAANDVVGQATARMNLGIVYSRLGDPLAALDCYAAAQPVFEAAHRQSSLALLYNNQGVDYRAIGQSANAIQAFQASVALRRRLPNQRSLANVLDNLARAYHDAGELTAARSTFDEALTILAALPTDPQVVQLQTGIRAQLAQLASSGDENRTF